MNTWKVFELIPPIDIFFGKYILPISSTYLLDNGETRILVDPGFPITLKFIIRELQEMKIGLSDIDYVIITHLHTDHYLSIMFFPKTRVVVSRKALSTLKENMSKNYDAEFTSQLEALLFRNKEILLLDKNITLLSGINIILTDLHQRGHLIVLVDTDNGCEAITGDALLINDWTLENILSGKIKINNPELTEILHMLLRKCKKIHQSHFPPLTT